MPIQQDYIKDYGTFGEIVSQVVDWAAILFFFAMGISGFKKKRRYVDPVDFLRGAHYHLVGPHFWYDAGDMAASKILCVLASDMEAGYERVGRWR